MPCFRGINCSIAALCNAAILPEFPHPDGSSVRLLAPEKLQNGSTSSPRSLGSPNGSERDPTRLQKVNAMISVYIPSVPGVQFWLVYNVSKVQSPTSYFFFKMYMNGRHITSWGVNNRTMSAGKVVRALYQPSERWQYTQDGVTFKPQGIESRYFHFATGPEKSVAEDGGLIEIRVFRSEARKRQAPDLEQCRGQDEYGVAALSGGLIENPQDMIFFTYLLTDPVDSPYATFRFHYRSWNNLKELSIIPDSEPRRFNSISSNSTCGSPATDGGWSPLEETDEASTEPSPDDQISIGLDSLDNAVLEDKDSCSKPKAEKDASHRVSAEYCLKNPPKLFPASSSRSAVPQPNKARRDLSPRSYLQRPLPELPRCSSPDDAKVLVRRISSASGNSSIAPSLLQCLEEDSLEEFQVELGIAKLVAIPESSSRASLAVDKCSTEWNVDGSLSDYDTSPPSTATDVSISSSDLLSPRNYAVTTGRTFERDLLYFSSPVARNSPLRISPKAKKILGDDVADDFVPSAARAINLTPSQWMRNTPSPDARAGKTDSPRPNRKLGKSLLSGFRRNRTRPRSIDCGSVPSSLRDSDHSRFAQEVKGRLENWI